MSEQDWAFAVQQLSVEMRAQHDLLRADMNRGFDGIREEMRFQNGRVRKAEEKLTVIETERKGEARQTLKRGAIASAVISGGIVAGWKALETWFVGH